MSRIGKQIIHIPDGVTVAVKDSVVTVKGAKGELVVPFSEKNGSQDRWHNGNGYANGGREKDKRVMGAHTGTYL